MIVYLVMSALGAAIGAPLLAPLSKPRPLQGFGLGSGDWMIFTTVLAVFVGPYPPPNWLRCHGLRETVDDTVCATTSPFDLLPHPAPIPPEPTPPAYF